MVGGIPVEHGSDETTPEKRDAAFEGAPVTSTNISVYAVRNTSGASASGDLDAGHLGAITVTDPSSEIFWKWADTLGFKVERDPAALAVLNYSSYPNQDGIRFGARSNAAYELLKMAPTQRWKIEGTCNSRSIGSVLDYTEQWSSNFSVNFEYESQTGMTGPASTRGYMEGLFKYLQDNQPTYLRGGSGPFNPERGNTGFSFYVGDTSTEAAFARNNQTLISITDTGDERADLCRASLWSAKSGSAAGGTDVEVIERSGYAQLMQGNLAPLDGTEAIEVYAYGLKHALAPNDLTVKRVWAACETNGEPPGGVTATPGNDQEDAATTTIDLSDDDPGYADITAYTAGGPTIDITSPVNTPLPAAGDLLLLTDEATLFHCSMVTGYSSMTITLEDAFGVAPASVTGQARWSVPDFVEISVTFDGTEEITSGVPADYRGFEIALPAGSGQVQAALFQAGWRVNDSSAGFEIGTYGIGGRGTTEQFDLLWEQNTGPSTGQYLAQRLFALKGVDLLIVFPKTQNEFSGSGSIENSSILAAAALAKDVDLIREGNPTAGVIFIGGPIIPSTLTNTRWEKETGNKNAIACWNLLCETAFDRRPDVTYLNLFGALGHPFGMYAWGFHQNPAHESARGSRFMWAYLIDELLQEAQEAATLANMQELTVSEISKLKVIAG